MANAHDTWSPRALEYSLTALEHLRAFASPLGVKLNVENILNEVTEPAHLLEILSTGHFKDIGVCLDSGHANISGSVRTALTELKDHIRSTHLHDNHGEKDEHLWPGDGTIAWAETMAELKTAPNSRPACWRFTTGLKIQPKPSRRRPRKAFERWRF